MADVPNPEQLRLFIALSIPDHVKGEFQRAQSKLRRELNLHGLRWSRPDQFHLTLKFLGNIAAARLEALTSGIREACSGFGPLELRAEKLGFFPRARAPRVLWAGITDDNDQLLAVQGAVDAATASFGAEASENRFRPHVTLARIATIRLSEQEALIRRVESLSGAVFGSWTATEIELVRSELSPRGATHTILAKAPLTLAHERNR